MVTLVKDTLVELQVATNLTKMARFLNSLPPLVAVVVWDVINGQITAKTVALADEATDDEWGYDVVRIIAALDPTFDISVEAGALVAEMWEEWESSQ